VAKHVAEALHELELASGKRPFDPA
jgi:hypothetical protein